METTRRDFLRMLGSALAALGLPVVEAEKEETPKQIHVKFTESEDVFEYRWPAIYEWKAVPPAPRSTTGDNPAFVPLDNDFSIIVETGSPWIDVPATKWITWVQADDELMQDAIDFSAFIKHELTKELSREAQRELDEFEQKTLYGDGSAEPKGIIAGTQNKETPILEQGA